MFLLAYILGTNFVKSNSILLYNFFSFFWNRFMTVFDTVSFREIVRVILI